MDTAVDYCAVPAAAPPAGQTSDLISPPNLRRVTIAVGSVCTAISLMFLTGRLLMNRKKLAPADHLSIVGFIFSTLYTAVSMYMGSYSRHMWDVPACWYLTDHLWIWLFISNIILGLTQFTAKLPIMVLYFQVFAVERRMKRFIMAAVLFSAIIYVPHPILVIIFQTPRAGESWSDLATDGRPQKLEYYAPIHGTLEVMLNFWMLLIPLLSIRKLMVSRRKKIQLTAIFLTGILGIVSSVMGAYWRFVLLLDKPGDQLWQEAQLFIWIMVEDNIAIVVGCMPACAALFLKLYASGSAVFNSLRTRMLGKISGSGGGSGGNTKEGLQEPVVVAAGFHSKEGQRGGRRGHTDYYEVNDTVPITQTDVAVVGPGRNYKTTKNEHGILKTVGLSQESHPYDLV